MRNLTFQHVVLGILFALCGTIGGWAITGKLAGNEAALSFLRFGCAVVVAMFFVQALLFYLSKKRLLYLLYFNVAFGCGIIWFMLCLILPLLWVDNIDGTAKIMLFSLLIALCASNIFQACLQFRHKWAELGEANLICQRTVNSGMIDWQKTVKALKFSIALYIPGVPQNMNPFISLMLVLSMLTGLAIRNVFPVAGLFAWGVPTCIAISTLTQMTGLGIAQIMKVMELEKHYGVDIASKT